MVRHADLPNYDNCNTINFILLCCVIFFKGFQTKTIICIGNIIVELLIQNDLFLHEMLGKALSESCRQMSYKSRSGISSSFSELCRSFSGESIVNIEGTNGGNTFTVTAEATIAASLSEMIGGLTKLSGEFADSIADDLEDVDEEDEGGDKNNPVDDWFEIESSASFFIFLRLCRISDRVSTSVYSGVLGRGILGSPRCLLVFQCFGRSLLA